MYWEESTAEQDKGVPGDIVDAVYGISCRTLPLDHACALSNAIRNELDWFADEPDAAVHAIHVAASGNGWYRPDTSGQLLYPSRRTKLTLRIPKQRIEDARLLVGKTLDIEGSALTVNNMHQKALSAITTLFARYIVIENAADEMAFLSAIMAALQQMGIKPKKMLCGKETMLAADDGPVLTRSLMIADLSVRESILLQQKGLGAYRWMGCGIFLPHKDIQEIGETMG
ncbi:MAG TPA: type I-MYXAN CRISPR-associated protein Cas6/Cmx6 [Gammaproteobacteria bacterium]